MLMGPTLAACAKGRQQYNLDMSAGCVQPALLEDPSPMLSGASRASAAASFPRVSEAGAALERIDATSSTLLFTVRSHPSQPTRLRRNHYTSSTQVPSHSLRDPVVQRRLTLMPILRYAAAMLSRSDAVRQAGSWVVVKSKRACSWPQACRQNGERVCSALWEVIPLPVHWETPT